MSVDFARVAIVNRGEPAMRFIHAIREFNLERGTAIQTVALYTEPDRRARFVREADEAIDLGSATFLDPADGQRKPRYLDFERLAEAITGCQADAVWAGWGFVAERADFVELCDSLGVVFLGPTALAMRRLADKISAKRLAEQSGIPVTPWGGEAASSLDVAWVHAQRLGYPVLVKAAAGAGGRAIRVAHTEGELPAAFDGTRREAGRIFGDSTVFVERYLQGVRHVEVQVQCDRHGQAWAIGLRDCTLQRRFQKLMAEAPVPGIEPAEEEALKAAAVRLCRAAEYQDAATVEFLFDPRTRQQWFMEVNARLQVEHPVTELTTGLDLVKLSLHVSRGGRLEGDAPATSGHAIEVRLNAENVDAGFSAAPGEIGLFRMPTGPGLRVDSGVGEGDMVPPEYDAMFAKLSTVGHTREEALGRLKRALAESAIAVTGGTTNRTLLLQLLDREEVREGGLHTGWLDASTAAVDLGGEASAGIALLQAAIEVHDAEWDGELEAFFSAAARMRPTARAEVGRQVDIGYLGHRYQFRVFRQGVHEYRIGVGGTQVDLRVERLGPCERWITHGDRRYHVISVVQGSTHLVEVDGIPHRISRADAGLVRAPGPAIVVSVNAKAGDRVAAGDRLAVLESMKMELAVTAPFSGTVRQVLVMPNAQVGATTPLVHVDALGQDGEPGTRVRFEGIALSPQKSERRVSRTRAILRGVRAGLGELRRGTGGRAMPALQAMRRLMLGFDVDPPEAKRLVSEYLRACQTVDATDSDQRRAEDDLLRIFVDLASIFARQSAADNSQADSTLSAEEYLFSYLRTLDARGAELPRSFVDQLQRAVSHYGLDSLEGTARLREALLWMFKANRRIDQRTPAVVAVLEQRALRGDAAESAGFQALLDRLIAVSRNRLPSLCDVARDLKYRAFDRPALEEGRRAVYATAEAHLATLSRDPFGAERQARIDALVDCPQPLKELFASRFETAPPSVREVMLEVLTRRYYRIRPLGTFTTVQTSERSVATTEFRVDDRQVRLVATHAGEQDIRDALETVQRVSLAVPLDRDVAVDLHVWTASELGDPDAASDELRALLDQVRFDRPVRRAVLMIAGPHVVAPSGHTQCYTFRSGPGGFREQRLYRGLHPMTAKRLELWRLRNFFVNRLPSVEDVYLFHGIARDNPKDERLFALAEVRDVTTIRDGHGRLVQIPHLDRVLMETLAAIRGVQLRRLPSERLQWNRVLLYVRPPLDLKLDELETIARRLGSEAEGLGLQKVVLRALVPRQGGELRDTVIRVALSAGHGMAIQFNEPTSEPIRPVTEYAQKVVRMRQRGLTYPYELVRLLTPSRESQADLPPGEFVEYDLQGTRLVPVDRPYGRNTANVVVGVVTSYTEKYPEGMSRVIILGDPSKEVGSLAEAECARIVAALDLAEQMRVPVEWFALSAGAKISMESGTENMDWIAKVLRRLIEFTQAGHEINILVIGITVGGQPYWNAEATMLMHTRGILLMTAEGAMVLTGKTALDYSGSVSAEDNQGIGGYEHIMGPNGQAQYWARDLGEACRILLRHYDHTYVMPGERFPRRALTRDPIARDVRTFPHGDVAGTTFEFVGDVFSDEKNPGRKKPFDIRRVMRAVADQDHEPLERWAHMRDAENAVTWDAHIGGYPVALLGFESRPVPRVGMVPPDGPEQFTSGTLFPMASKKVARFINAAGGTRPLVILANLSGFDGSPESMRRRQLEFGAEIGRAVVNYQGPIVFCVISRYHGGAFVVFSKALNPHMEVVALEGTYASVIGGAPAAAVVFAREVDARTRKDPRVEVLQRELDAAPDADRKALRSRLSEVTRSVRSERLGEVADEFDRIHSVHRALQVGSLDRIIRAADLRPYLVDAIERGMARFAGALTTL
jgi:acetyl/propionyl-CoA carboxylase alpha subunit/acetyl-CoA carboxylase carboxyltransferase component